MKIVVYWEESGEEAWCKRMVDMLRDVARRFGFPSAVVLVRSWTDIFNQAVERALDPMADDDDSYTVYVGSGVHSELALPNGAICKLDPPIPMSVPGTIRVTMPKNGPRVLKADTRGILKGSP